MLAQVITAIDPIIMREARFAALIGLAGLLGAVTPGTVEGQAARPDSAAIDEARLTAYAKAFAGIAVVRDSISKELALPRNKTLEVQLELREKLRTQIEKVLKEQNLTPDEYARITHVISTDAAHSKTFEEILARLTQKPAPR